jgi:hypothetical protein
MKSRCPSPRGSMRRLTGAPHGPVTEPLLSGSTIRCCCSRQSDQWRSRPRHSSPRAGSQISARFDWADDLTARSPREQTARAYPDLLADAFSLAMTVAGGGLSTGYVEGPFGFWRLDRLPLTKPLWPYAGAASFWLRPTGAFRQRGSFDPTGSYQAPSQVIQTGPVDVDATRSTQLY